jgi:nucleoid-associated protein YgaU
MSAFPRLNFTAALAATALISVAATAQTPAPAPAPKPTAPQPTGARPGPTLTQVKAGPDEVIHVVKKGDTLWDLANFYLKDPWKWPDVFRRNTDIVENPHWIYPGETIRIPSTEVKPEVLAQISTRPAPPSDRTVFSTQPMGLPQNQLNAGVIGRGEEGGVPRGEIDAAPFATRLGGPSSHGAIAAAYDRPGIAAAAGERRFQLHDRVFLEVPRTVSAHPGDLLLAYRLGEQITETSQVLIPTGILRVVSQQPGQPAMAQVVKQFDEILVDQEVTPLDNAVASVGAPSSVAPGPEEKVLYVQNSPVLPSLQSYVIVSSGSMEGVRVGDQFTLIDDSVDPRHPAPPVPAAAVEVVKVTPYGVTAIVVDHEQPKIYAGMKARLTARAP